MTSRLAIPQSGLLAARPAASAYYGWWLATDVAGGTLYYSNGTTWTAVSPGINVAGVELGYADLASDPASFSNTATDLLTINVTATAQLVVEAEVPQVTLGGTIVAGTSYVAFYLRDGSNAILDQAVYIAPVTTAGALAVPLNLRVRLPRVGGANAYAITPGNPYTFKLSAVTNASTVTGTINTGSGNHRPTLRAFSC